MVIRNEASSDVEHIFNVTKAAFENHPFSNGTEQFIINALRKAEALTVSLVAELDGKVVGHIAFSPVTLTDNSQNWFGLGPVSVEPALQRQGIGSKLINDGLNILRQNGANGCILVGDPGFYERFGFTSLEGLQHEGVPQANFMVLSFCGDVPTGFVNFHPAFTATE